MKQALALKKSSKSYSELIPLFFQVKNSIE